MWLFDDNKIKMARKPGKKLKQNPVGALGKVKDEKKIRERYREDKFGGEVTIVI